MSLVLNCNQIREIEKTAVGLGMGWLRLMENAGSAAAKEIRDRIDSKDKKIVIVCGKGNNGGDGYVVARKLTEKFSDIKVISVGQPSTDSAREMASKAQDIGIKPIPFEVYETLCYQYIAGADVIVDALLGIGLRGEPEGDAALVINAINESNAYKVSVDVPSGINGDNGTVGRFTVDADLTVTFTAYKPCQFLYPASKKCGQVKLTSIGIPTEVFAGVEPAMRVVTESHAISLLPTRETDCHKGTCGTAGLFVGNIGYAGAALIAGKAAVKSGVGIANMIIPEGIYNIIGSSLPEGVCTVLKGDSYESIHENDGNRIINTLNKCTAALIGCGLGQSIHVKNIVQRILKSCSVPLVIDADGINVLCDSIELIRQYDGGVVLTPHPKEASRLLGCTVEDIQNNRLIAVREIAARTNTVTVLKGAKTLISCPSGKTYVVTDGNPGMATAGTGDMLAGMVVAFMAQGLSPESAAVLAVKLHAVAGDMALENSSLLSLTPTDMINMLPDLYCRLYLKK